MGKKSAIATFIKYKFEISEVIGINDAPYALIRAILSEISGQI